MSIKIKQALIFFAVAVCLAAIFLYWQFYGAAKNLEVDFLDVGQGDAILIKLPGGQNILIDGGPDKSVVKRLGENLAWWDKTVDLMILTHPHDDHVTGLIDVLKRYRVKRILYTGVNHTAPNYLAWLKIVKEKKTPLVIIDRPQTVDLGRGAWLEILFPRASFLNKIAPELNDTSVIIRLVYGQNKFLFTGDAGEKAEQELITAGADLSAAVLKVAHHGSEYSSAENFLAAVKPEIAVISVGQDNDFGHPNGRIIKRLERAGAEILRTDSAGTIKIIGDGLKLSAE